MSAKKVTHEETIDKKQFSVDANLMKGIIAGVAIAVYFSVQWKITVEHDITELKSTQVKQEKTNAEYFASIQTLTSMLTSLQADVKEIKNNTSRR